MKGMENITQGGFLISKIQKLSARIFAKMLKDFHLTINPGQGRILFVLWQKDGIPIQDLAKKTSLSTSTLTSMLDRMEHAKLIKREPKPEDRRSYLIVLQRKAGEMKQKFIDISAQMSQIYYADIMKEDQVRFESTLEKLLQNLEIYAEKQ